LDSANTTGSFYVVDNKENEKSFVVLNEDNGSDSNNKSETRLSTDNDKPQDSENSGSREQSNARVTFEMSDLGVGQVEEVLQVKVTEGNTAENVPQIEVQDDTGLTQSQRDATDILASVKLVIGEIFVIFTIFLDASLYLCDTCGLFQLFC
jgi:hypothetical protein